MSRQTTDDDEMRVILRWFCELDFYLMVEKFTAQKKYDFIGDAMESLITDIHSQTRTAAESFEKFMKAYYGLNQMSCPKQETLTPAIHEDFNIIREIAILFANLTIKINEYRGHIISVFGRSNFMTIIINKIDEQAHKCERLFGEYVAYRNSHSGVRGKKK